MSVLRATYCILLSLVVLSACNKAPDDVISENKMARLIVDLNKAEYYIESHNGEFPNDSTRMALKQSIFAKHGVDQELYDHSLEWYGHNMDVYVDVCDRAMRQLDDEKKKLSKRVGQEPLQPTRNLTPSQTAYANHGDTADVWQGRRWWLLTAGMRQGTLRWDVQPDAEHQPGDKYLMRVKVTSNTHGMTVTLAADYTDGGTTTVTRPLTVTDWNMVALQTDSLRQLRRIYGYIRYNMEPQTVALIDSVALVRTHLDRNSYGLIGSQMTINRQGEPAKPASALPHPTRPAPDAHELRDRADDEARATFRPKPGVNKSSHPRHIEHSPNSQHLPK